MTQADSPLQMEEPLAGDTEIGIRYSMGGMGSAGYLLFFFASSIFAVALIYLAWHQENNFLLWLLAATSGLLSMVFLIRGMGDAWRITTKTWGFEAWDGGLIAVRWEEVASYHHDDTGDSLEYLKIRFKPGASCRRDLSIDVTNLEPPVEQLLRTFAHAAASKNWERTDGEAFKEVVGGMALVDQEKSMTDTTYGDSNIQGTSARAINLCIGAGALLLGPGLVLVGWVSSYFLLTHPGWLTAPSISEYYYFNELTRNGFVGTMCAVGLLMSAYRGWHQRNLWDRVIAVWSLIFAWLVGLVPCNSALSVVHFSAAGLLFGLMAAMLWFRFTDFTRDAAEDRDRAWKEVRNRIYKSCACVIIAAIGVKALSMTGLVGLDTISSGNLTFWVEVTGLSAFSFGWLTKSRYILGYQATDGWFSRSWRTAAN